MSLAMYAAPFDNNDNMNNMNNTNNYNQDTAINRKKNHAKTQKRITQPEYNSQKVNAVLQSIHNSSSDESNTLGDFTPPPPPTSMGVENTRMKEGMANINTSSNSPEPLEDENVDVQSLNNSYMNNKTVEEYYKNLIPNYNQNHTQYKGLATNHNRPYYSQQSLSLPSSMESDNYKMLTDKLNYMINLLEEQQDEKTNNVTEEVVLYSFLGIFIIFVVDSFARVGKYVR